MQRLRHLRGSTPLHATPTGTRTSTLPTGGPFMLAAALLLGLAACDSSTALPDPVSRRDSAGVEIVETTQPAWSSSQPWVLDSIPSLSIGLLEGDPAYLFGSLTGAVRLSDGTIAVADEQGPIIRYFDGGGQFIREVGRPGEGPGEFGSLYQLRACGEGVFADDRSRQRVHVWGPRGDYQTEFALVEPDGDGSRGPYRWVCSSSGEIIAAGWGERTFLMGLTESAFFPSAAPIWLLDNRGQKLLTLGEYVVSERVFIYSAAGGGGGSTAPHPFGRFASFAADDSGIYIGTAERMEVRVFDRAGVLRRIQRGPDIDLSITPEMLEQYRNANLSGAAGRIVELIGELSLALPPGLPAYSELRSDADGFLWAKRFQHPWEETSRWAVFGPDGVFLGELTLQAGFVVYDIGSDFVLGVAEDELGIQRVQLYELDRGLQ